MRITYTILFFLYLFAKAALFAQTNVNGDVSGTWTKANSPYVLTGPVNIQPGQTLTIEPGVTIHSGSYLYHIFVSGTLTAIGTVADSIKFEGFATPNNSTSTHGGSIRFEASSMNSILEYVDINRWGDTGSYGGEAVYIANSQVSISKSTIRNSESYGIRITSSSVSPTITNNNFSNNIFDIATYPGNSRKITSNHNAIIHLLSGQTSGSGVLQKQGVNSYFKLDNSQITISQGDTLEIKPGVVIRSYHYNDYFSISGTLIAKGIPADSIKFIGHSNTNISASTHGGSIRFEAGSKHSQLEYVDINRWGDINFYGDSYGALYISTTGVNISKTTIRNSEGYGIRISAGAISPTVVNNNFSGNPTDIGTYIHTSSNIASNTNAVIRLLSSSTNQDGILQKQGANSYFKLEDNQISISQQDTLEIKPGVVIRSYHYNDYFSISGALIVKGTAADSIKFIGYSNANISASTHGGSIRFEAGSNHSQLEYVDINRWGDVNYYGDSYGAVYINTTGVTISKTTIRNSEGYGIRISAGAISPTVVNNNFSGNPTDIGTYIHTSGNISSNTNAAIRLLSSSTNQDGVLQKQGTNSYFKLEDNHIVISQQDTLEIKPGVVIHSYHYSDYISITGTLIARGTQADSIKFIGYTNAGISASTHGGSIRFEAGSNHSQLEYVDINRWGDIGYYGDSYGAVYANTTGVTISKTTIRNSESYGIRISAGAISPTIVNNNFSGNLTDIGTYIHTSSNISSNINAVIRLLSSSTNQKSILQKQGTNSYFKLENNQIGISQQDTLEIKPGVEIRSYHYNDYFRVYGTLIAKGTPADSIKFRGYPNPIETSSSHGGSIRFETGSKHSQLEYVDINRWGDYYSYAGSALYIYTSGVSLTHSTIRNSEASGIHVENGAISPIVANNNFSGNLTDIGTYIQTAGNITSNTNAAIRLLSGATNQKSILQKQGVNSYFKLDNNQLIVSQQDTLEIRPGVEIRSYHYSDYFRVYGTLIAKGTPADSIKFRGYPNPIETSSSHGGSIRFEAGSKHSQLEYVDINRWGDTGYLGTALYINTSEVFVSKSGIRNSENYGIQLVAQNISPSIQNNVFFNNPTADISAYGDNCGGILNNTNARVLINSGSTTANVSWPFPGINSYYILYGQVTIPQAYTLTIEAGTLVHFDLPSGGELYVNGTLRAQGTETAPIQLVRLQTPNSSTPGGRVYLAPGSTGSVISYVLFDKLGSTAYGYPALQLSTGNFSITNITVSNSLSNGLQYSASGAPIITASNFYNNKTGIYVTGGSPAFDKCNIYGNTDFGINNISNTIGDTVDARNSYWGDVSGPLHTILNPLGAGNKVSDKVKFNPWKQQPQNGQITDIGVSSILSPITDCNLTNAADLTIRISNYGNVSVSNFPVSYKINNGAAITENVTGAPLLPGRTFDYTFTTKANLSTTGSYIINAFTKLSLDSLKTNDTTKVSIQHLPSLPTPANLIPANNTANLDISLSLSWSSVSSVESYDLFVWKASESVPTIPLISGLSQINYTIPFGVLTYGTQYNWKVVAKRASCRAESIVQSFTTRQLPDLIVQSISVPPTATSETDITISFNVKNQGVGSTGATGWQDVIYLCDQPTLYAGVDNFFVASASNFSALAANQSYQSATYTFRLPQGIQGNYYVIVQTNASSSLTESTNANNQKVSVPINVSLAPPPDLQVTSVVAAPQNPFSEDSVTVTYKVRNLGTGPTTKNNWTDYIYLTQNEVLNPNTATLLSTHNRSQGLSINEEYTIIAKTKLPARISGTYYIHIFTDRFNQIFEYNKEDNNIGTSLPLNVIQKPTPDLTAGALSFSIDSVSNNQPVTVQWTTANDGAITAQPSWQEYIYLSNNAVYDAGSNLIVGTVTRQSAINSLNSVSGQHVINIPGMLQEGSYYFYVKTDATNSIYENPDENNNVSPASAVIHVVNTDLKPTQLNAPLSAQSEQNIVVQWKVKNDSRGNIINQSWTDKVYLSSNTTLEPGTDILLGSAGLNQLVGKGAEYSKQISVSLPLGISGSYYLLLVTDADNNVFEKLETNNLISKAINISLAPWPDLQVTGIVAPAIDTVGTLINLQYTIRNNGSGNINNKSWEDHLYLSPTNNANEINLTFLGTIIQNRSLTGGQTVSQTASFFIPSSLAAGIYYVFVKSDKNNAVFENTDENNNTTIAGATTALTVLPPPLPIDLSVNGGQILSTTVTAGQPANIQWTVKNNSAGPTTTPSWKDAIYLSNNPVLDANDILLSTITVNGPIAAGATYTKTATVTIPQTASGTLYILVNTDKDNQNNDDTRGNNTLPLNSGGGGQTVVITIPPPADLVPLSFITPAQGTVSQPIEVTFKVKNQGSGSTPAGSWNDQIYLSTDYTLGSNDIAIGTFTHSGILDAGTDYTVSGQVFLPGGITGNYILLLKADANDQVFERNNEGNNLAFANIFINPQQPSDLVVTDITVPTGEQYAGSNTTISWQLKNVGTNPAIGFMRESVYFSKDSVLDASDILFGFVDQSTSLPAQATENKTLTQLLTNITVGEYYVILKTDILNNIVEINENNNVRVAGGKLKVTVKELSINVLKSDTLTKSIPLYYRIEIPQSLVNETLQVDLKGDTTNNAINRLYISYNKTPTSNVFDFESTLPFSANQGITISELKAGTYYLLALGEDPAKIKQPITLLAKVIPFSITSITANQGGNTGLITVKISGAKFDNKTIFKLSKSPAETILPNKVYFIDQTIVFATYNLSGKTIGAYNVEAVKQNGETTTLPNGFMVVEGPASGFEGTGSGFICNISNVGFEEGLETNIVAPASARLGQVISFTVAYKNVSSVDIPVQTRFLISLNENIPVGFNAAELKDKKQDLILVCEEKNGPTGILRPGAGGFFKIYTVSNNRTVPSIDINIIE